MPDEMAAESDELDYDAEGEEENIEMEGRRISYLHRWNSADFIAACVSFTDQPLQPSEPECMHVEFPTGMGADGLLRSNSLQ